MLKKLNIILTENKLNKYHKASFPRKAPLKIKNLSWFFKNVIASKSPNNSCLTSKIIVPIKEKNKNGTINLLKLLWIISFWGNCRWNIPPLKKNQGIKKHNQWEYLKYNSYVPDHSQQCPIIIWISNNPPTVSKYMERLFFILLYIVTWKNSED